MLCYAMQTDCQEQAEREQVDSTQYVCQGLRLAMNAAQLDATGAESGRLQVQVWFPIFFPALFSFYYCPTSSPKALETWEGGDLGNPTPSPSKPPRGDVGQCGAGYSSEK